MKKNIMDYYALAMLLLFIVYNFFLGSLIIYGLLYKVFMLVLIIVNAIILIIIRKRIKYKTLIIIVYLLIWTWPFSSDSSDIVQVLQTIFAFSNIILLCITGFREKNSIKIISFLIVIFGYKFCSPLLFVFMAFTIGSDSVRLKNNIYEDTHYYCENNYEVYSYSAYYSAYEMDGFHYSIGKHYEFLDIDGIIHISYNEQNEVSQEEYENYLNTHKCKLVGDINGSE